MKPRSNRVGLFAFQGKIMRYELTKMAFAALTISTSTLFASTHDGTNVADATEWKFNAGADFRMRQEMMDNIPGNPGDIYSIAPVKRGKNKNQMRFRPRAWFAVENGPFRLYSRITDEFREYPVENGQRKKDRAYNFPDELFLDNLYLEGNGLELDYLNDIGIEKFDFRFGRQDLFERGHSIFGLDRIIADGTPLDGSRGFFADMMRVKLHFNELHSVDLFTLYCNGRNNIRWGNNRSEGRAMNPINMSDSNEMDEWGGGIVYSGVLNDKALPFKAYSIFKRSEAYTTSSPIARNMSAKEITTVGTLFEPKFSDQWSMELEGAKQFGRILDGNKQAGGFMGHVAINYRPKVLREYSPVVSWATTYYSGDRHRTEKGNNDTAWDPMWARFTQDSEMLVYGALYGNCYWSNMIYSKLKLTMKFAPHHGFYAYTGPMFVAEQDRLGHADGSGDSMYKGWLSAARYDFPIRLAPKNATGVDRFELFGHIVAEVFQPGDYFDSSKPAYFIRWQIDFRF